jgi:predicted RNase H-like HicB family nuclease
VASLPSLGLGRDMYRVWYWAVVGRESDGRFIASIPDLDDLAAYGGDEKDAVAHITELAAEHVRTLIEGRQSVPRPRPAAEMPSAAQPTKIGRAMISVRVERAVAKPQPFAPPPVGG